MTDHPETNCAPAKPQPTRINRTATSASAPRLDSSRSALIPISRTTPARPDPWAHPAPEDGCLYRLDQPHISETRADASELEPLSSFVANQPTPRYPRTRRRWLPCASVGLYVSAQLILAAAIGLGHVPALGGVAVCLALLICGLVLIACQILAEAPIGGGPTP